MALILTPLALLGLPAEPASAQATNDCLEGATAGTTTSWTCLEGQNLGAYYVLPTITNPNPDQVHNITIGSVGDPSLTNNLFNGSNHYLGLFNLPDQETDPAFAKEINVTVVGGSGAASDPRTSTGTSWVGGVGVVLWDTGPGSHDLAYATGKSSAYINFTGASFVGETAGHGCNTSCTAALYANAYRTIITARSGSRLVTNAPGVPAIFAYGVNNRVLNAAILETYGKGAKTGLIGGELFSDGIRIATTGAGASYVDNSGTILASGIDSAGIRIDNTNDKTTEAGNLLGADQKNAAYVWNDGDITTGNSGISVVANSAVVHNNAAITFLENTEDVKGFIGIELSSEGQTYSEGQTLGHVAASINSISDLAKQAEAVYNNQGGKTYLYNGGNITSTYNQSVGIFYDDLAKAPTALERTYAVVINDGTIALGKAGTTVDDGGSAIYAVADDNTDLVLRLTNSNFSPTSTGSSITTLSEGMNGVFVAGSSSIHLHNQGSITTEAASASGIVVTDLAETVPNTNNDVFRVIQDGSISVNSLSSKAIHVMGGLNHGTDLTLTADSVTRNRAEGGQAILVEGYKFHNLTLAGTIEGQVELKGIEGSDVYISSVPLITVTGPDTTKVKATDSDSDTLILGDDNTPTGSVLTFDQSDYEGFELLVVSGKDWRVTGDKNYVDGVMFDDPAGVSATFTGRVTASNGQDPFGLIGNTSFGSVGDDELVLEMITGGTIPIFLHGFDAGAHSSGDTLHLKNFDAAAQAVFEGTNYVNFETLKLSTGSYALPLNSGNFQNLEIESDATLTAAVNHDFQEIRIKGTINEDLVGGASANRYVVYGTGNFLGNLDGGAQPDGEEDSLRLLGSTAASGALDLAKLRNLEKVMIDSGDWTLSRQENAGAAEIMVSAGTTTLDGTATIRGDFTVGTSARVLSSGDFAKNVWNDGTFEVSENSNNAIAGHYRASTTSKTVFTLNGASSGRLTIGGTAMIDEGAEFEIRGHTEIGQTYTLATYGMDGGISLGHVTEALDSDTGFYTYELVNADNAIVVTPTVADAIADDEVNRSPNEQLFVDQLLPAAIGSGDLTPSLQSFLDTARHEEINQFVQEVGMPSQSLTLSSVASTHNLILGAMPSHLGASFGQVQYESFAGKQDVLKRPTAATVQVAQRSGIRGPSHTTYQGRTIDRWYRDTLKRDLAERWAERQKLLRDQSAANEQSGDSQAGNKRIVRRRTNPNKRIVRRKAAAPPAEKQVNSPANQKAKDGGSKVSQTFLQRNQAVKNSFSQASGHPVFGDQKSAESSGNARTLRFNETDKVAPSLRRVASQINNQNRVLAWSNVFASTGSTKRTIDSGLSSKVSSNNYGGALGAEVRVSDYWKFGAGASLVTGKLEAEERTNLTADQQSAGGLVYSDFVLGRLFARTEGIFTVSQVNFEQNLATLGELAKGDARAHGLGVRATLGYELPIASSLSLSPTLGLSANYSKVNRFSLVSDSTEVEYAAQDHKEVFGEAGATISYDFLGSFGRFALADKDSGRVSLSGKVRRQVRGLKQTTALRLTPNASFSTVQGGSKKALAYEISPTVNLSLSNFIGIKVGYTGSLGSETSHAGSAALRVGF